ncbi:hypothetical protein EQZ20_24505 (plasmid) [Bacillus glycinifermentans]|uniref:Uncharacterized protein n=1 Tax=Bacillus glycinifermentans TaxID=1664069 RepID=A0AAJ4D541_9BACI|nr:hypothetical protein [Bacillus glycinifermentans]QAT68038.1 hypothetical protein EQZ20_24505 [Bacillus glycinifermentans]
MKNDFNKNESISIRIHIDDHSFLRQKAFESRSTIVDTLSNIINTLKSEIDNIYIPQYGKSKSKVKTKSVLVNSEDHEFLKEIAFHRNSRIIEVVKILITEYRRRNGE